MPEGALRDRVGVGVSIPHRSTDTISRAEVDDVVRRAEAHGFSDVWVTENTLSMAPRRFCFDPIVVLTHVAAITSTVGLGAAVIVLPVHNPIHVAHQVACLDYLSGGRARLAVGLGRDFNYTQFQVSPRRRVRRFLESVAVMRALWSEDRVDFAGSFYVLDGVGMRPKPAQTPMPLWFGGSHPDAVRRAAALADGWIASGGSSTAKFVENTKVLGEALSRHGRDPTTFAVSKRVFTAIEDDRANARRRLDRWFGKSGQTVASGVYGTAEDVGEQLDGLVAMGATHLLLNPVGAYAEQVDALADVVSR